MPHTQHNYNNKTYNDYSQKGESWYLFKYILDNKIKVPNKLIVDIGALDGLTNSNSRIFLDNGWKGILFEPNRQSYSDLVRNNFAKNNELYNAAITNENKLISFQENKKIKGHSKITTNKATNKVMGATLDYFTSEQIGILDIDVEGHELVILNDILDKKIYPNFLIVECNTPKAENETMKLLSDKYEKLVKISVNLIMMLKP